MSSVLPLLDSHFPTLSNQGEPSRYPLEGANIELIELHDEPTAGGVIPSLLSVYQQRGYERGYQRAVNDILISLFSVTEDFVKAHSLDESSPESTADLRRVLYQFGQQLERRLQVLAPDSGYVSDGLGI
jgi:hypothetical protein